MPLESNRDKTPQSKSPEIVSSRRRTMLLVGIALIVMFAIIVDSWFGLLFGRPSINDLKKQYQQAASSKNWRRAEAVASQWTAVAPDSGEAWMQRSNSLYQQKKYQAALDCLNCVIPPLPQTEIAMIAKMELQFGPLNRPIEGAETCEKLIEANPRSTIARQQLIQFLAMTLQRTRLVREIRRAIVAGVEPPDSYFYLFFIDVLPFANGAELNRRCLAGDPDSELFEVAEAIFSAESLETTFSMDDRANAEAIRRAIADKSPVMEKLLTKFPHNTELLAYSVRQLMQKGDIPGVVKLLGMASIEAEGDHRFWRFKGWVHAEQNEIEEAENAYRQAIELHPLDWNTRHMLAELLQKQERYDEVRTLRDLVSRANQLRRALQVISNETQVSAETLLQLAEYAADCGENQLANSLRQGLRRSNGRSR